MQALFTYLKKTKTSGLKKIISAEPIQDSGHFGISTSVFDRHILVGAHQTLTNGINSGKAFLFDLDSNSVEIPIYQFANQSVSSNDFFASQVSLGFKTYIECFKTRSLCFSKQRHATTFCDFLF